MESNIGNIENINENVKDKQHSIEVSRTSTNKYSYSVKYYFADIKEAEDILFEIDSIESKLKEKYGNENKV